MDAAYHQSINKAIIMDNERNKENLSDSAGNRSYLTLQKFNNSNGGEPAAEISNLSYSNSRRHDLSSNSLMNRNVFSAEDETLNDQQSKSKASAHSSRNASINAENATNATTNLFEVYGNQISKNIQSIRRNSNSSASSAGSNHEKPRNIVENRRVSGASAHSETRRSSNQSTGSNHRKSPPVNAGLGNDHCIKKKKNGDFNANSMSDNLFKF